MILTTVRPDENAKMILNSKDVLIITSTATLLIIAYSLLYDWEVQGLWAYAAVGMLFAPLFTLIYGWTEYYPINFKKSGKVEIADQAIKINDTIYEYHEIKNLTFLVNDFRGKRLRRPGVLVNAGPSLSRGVDNRIKFEHNQTKIEVQFLLESENHLLSLGNRLKEMYLLGLSFTEKLNQSKSYGMKHLRYKEIQSFKRKSYR